MVGGQEGGCLMCSLMFTRAFLLQCHVLKEQGEIGLADR